MPAVNGANMSSPPTARDVIPHKASLSEAYVDQPGAGSFPGEESLTLGTVPARTAEIRTTRTCARTALTRLGVPPVALLRDAHGAPIWPPGIVGSMTHCAGYRGAVVSARIHHRSLGIDAEPHASIPEEILEEIVGPDERAMLSELERRWPAVCWDRLVFSAKESFYKAWYPVNSTWLDHQDVVTRIDGDHSTFTAHAQTPGRSASYHGRFVITPTHLLTLVAVPA